MGHTAEYQCMQLPAEGQDGKVLQRNQPFSDHRAVTPRSLRRRNPLPYVSRTSGVLVAAMMRKIIAPPLLAVLLVAAPSAAQTAPPVEQVRYVNPFDGNELTAVVVLPEGPGPHPGVVLLSVAGTDLAIERLVGEGYAVLAPELRGFVTVEPLLRATFEDLAGDVSAAVTYLGNLASVDGDALALVAQADNTPQAMLFAARREPAVPLVLMAPPAFPGVETFRREQRWIAGNQGADPAELEALDAYVREIAGTVLNARTPSERLYRLEALRARSRIELPRNAAFPADERQMRFFASRLWHDRLAFEPEAALAALTGPVLVLIGTEDPNTPMDDYVAALERGLAEANTDDTRVRVIPGRTRHTFSPAALDEILAWLARQR